MRQIDHMTPNEIEVLKLKNMTSTHTPFQPLHPTLKACKCGLVGTRSQFYHHLGLFMKLYRLTGSSFWKDHGEVPLRADDPRVSLTPRELAASEASM